MYHYYANNKKTGDPVIDAVCSTLRSDAIKTTLEASWFWRLFHHFLANIVIIYLDFEIFTL